MVIYSSTRGITVNSRARDRIPCELFLHFAIAAEFIVITVVVVVCYRCWGVAWLDYPIGDLRRPWHLFHRCLHGRAGFLTILMFVAIIPDPFAMQSVDKRVRHEIRCCSSFVSIRIDHSSPFFLSVVLLWSTKS